MKTSAAFIAGIVVGIWLAVIAAISAAATIIAPPTVPAYINTTSK